MKNVLVDYLITYQPTMLNFLWMCQIINFYVMLFWITRGGQ